MPLVNQTTNLKSLRYGSDRRDQGSSNQPYVTTPIPNGEGPGLGDVDFLLRGGSLLPASVVNDVSRLTQMMFDFKSPNGVLFTVKQNALSRSAVNQMAVANNSSVVNLGKNSNRLPLNNGIYLPTSTLAQAAVNPLGGHLLKQGINPFASTNDIANGNSLSTGFGDLFPLSNPLYIDSVAQDERQTNVKSSRLIQFLDNKISSSDGNQTNLYSYSGGPGSTLGVGKTNILMSKDRTGLNNPQLKDSGFFSTGKSPDTNFGFDYSIFKGGVTNPNFETFRGGTYFGNIKDPLNTKSVTGKYLSQTFSSITDLLGTGVFKTDNDNINGGFISEVGQSVYQLKRPDGLGFQANNVVGGLGTTLDYDKLMSSGTSNVLNDSNLYGTTSSIQDFRKLISPISGVTAGSLSYANQSIEPRVNLGNPGTRNTSTSYVTGNGRALDKINARSLYKSKDAIKQSEASVNDLCTFRIGVIDNDNPELKTYIHFRAFIDSMDDSYTADWGSQTFSGRAENLYNYQGFDRSVNLSWTVAAQSKQELIPMYQKLNYLASVCAPDYSSNGYMRGNLIELTVGGYLYNQVGIMKGIQFSIPQESPWEIGINDTDGKLDDSVKELPFIIKVSGFSFIPIHNFVPNLQKNIFASTSNSGSSVEGDLDIFGPERYISLSNSEGNNYTTKLDDNNNTTQIDI